MLAPKCKRWRTRVATLASIAVSLLICAALTSCSSSNAPQFYSTSSAGQGGSQHATVIARQTVTSAGGAIQVTSGPLAGVTLTIPAGALSTPVTFTITTASDLVGPAIPAAAMGPAFTINPQVIFSKPVTLTVPVSPTLLATRPGVGPNNLLLVDQRQGHPFQVFGSISGPLPRGLSLATSGPATASFKIQSIGSNEPDGDDPNNADSDDITSIQNPGSTFQPVATTPEFYGLGVTTPASAAVNAPLSPLTVTYTPASGMASSLSQPVKNAVFDSSTGVLQVTLAHNIVLNFTLTDPSGNVTGATLSGSLSLDGSVSGAATFDGITVDTPGSYIITVTSNSMISKTTGKPTRLVTGTFTVGTGPPSAQEFLLGNALVAPIPPSTPGNASLDDFTVSSGGVLSSTALSSVSNGASATTDSSYMATWRPPGTALGSATGGFVYLSLGGTQSVAGSLTGWSIDSSGTLTPITLGSNLIPSGVTPGAIYVDPTTGYLFVAGNDTSSGQGSLLGYQVDPSTGALTPFAGNGSTGQNTANPINSMTSVTVSTPGGPLTFLITGEEGGSATSSPINLETWVVGTASTTSVGTAQAAAVDGVNAMGMSGNILYLATDATSGNLQSYSIDQTGGITSVGQVTIPVAPNGFLNSLAVATPNGINGPNGGGLVYLTEFGTNRLWGVAPGTGGSLSASSILNSGNALETYSASAEVSTDAAPPIDGDNLFVALETASSNLLDYSINTSSGLLTQTGTTSTSTPNAVGATAFHL